MLFRRRKEEGEVLFKRGEQVTSAWSKQVGRERVAEVGRGAGSGRGGGVQCSGVGLGGGEGGFGGGEVEVDF